MSPDEFIAELWSYAEEVPMAQHPWFQGILQHRRYATDEETQEKIRRAVKLGVTAFTLEWDGHVQAMTGQREFWGGGVAPLRLRQPPVRLPEARCP